MGDSSTKPAIPERFRGERARIQNGANTADDLKPHYLRNNNPMGVLHYITLHYIRVI